MADDFIQVLRKLAANENALTFNRGIEREALRVDPQGNLARTPHPAFLGSKLTHPSVTTDFSEAQLELITPVSNSIDDTLGFLQEVHQFVSQGLGEETIWSASMPCVLAGDNSIPLAQYGSSNLARLKTTYRNGLGYRYGRSMQTICAVHYNFSFSDSLWSTLAQHEEQTLNPDYVSRRYFDLMRNFRRMSWLPIYLFGASPAVCNSFVRGRSHSLERFDEGSLYAKGATSLRSGNLGYQSDAQGSLIHICYNSLSNYTTSLARAICTPHPDYVKIGLVKDGEYLQVNPNILQSEAEFYTSIRAKRVPPKGANFLKVLSEGGVEYLEVRLLDVNPYLPLGVDAMEVRFLDMLLLYGLLIESPEHDDAQCNAVKDNMQAVVWQGRDTEVRLLDGDTERSVMEWGLEILRAMEPIAAALDRASGGNAYASSLAGQRDKVGNPEATPSAQILKDMRDQSIPFFRFAMNKALSHKRTLNEQPLDKDRKAYFDELSRVSINDQKELEASDKLDFDTYLANLNQSYTTLF